jgi:Animal haem peroxidase
LRLKSFTFAATQIEFRCDRLSGGPATGFSFASGISAQRRVGSDLIVVDRRSLNHNAREICVSEALAHGAVGAREEPFTSILPTDHPGYPPDKLLALSIKMKADADSAKDGPDPEENLWVPAGYTYFGQFIDHDLTFDSTSSLNPADTTEGTTRFPTNLRTPRLDLDCVYGDGPDAQPFMYDAKGEKLLLGSVMPGSNDANGELLRAPNGRAIIGDKRNDENSIVNQIQSSFIKFHNTVVDRLRNDPASWTVKGNLFKSAQNVVRWTYQQLILEDFLPRIIRHEVLADLTNKSPDQRESAYVLYTDELRTNLPREFVSACYRFGHSGVRPGYRLNRLTLLEIFPNSQESTDGDSLLGFEPLAAAHVIDDWGRFLTDAGPSPNTSEVRNASTKAKDGVLNPDVRLQYAYKLDPTLVDNLGVLPIPVAGPGTTDEAKVAIKPADLPDTKERPKQPRPSLALLNLLRANIYNIQNGQAYANILAEKYKDKYLPLDAKHLAVRVPAGKDGFFKFEPIDSGLQKDTPLWFYILAEAQAPALDFLESKATNGVFTEDEMLSGDGAKTQLGWVGGRIVAEVFYGLIDADEDSFVGPHAPKGWRSPLRDKSGLLLLKNLVTLSFN